MCATAASSRDTFQCCLPWFCHLYTGDKDPSHNASGKIRCITTHRAFRIAPGTGESVTSQLHTHAQTLTSSERGLPVLAQRALRQAKGRQGSAPESEAPGQVISPPSCPGLCIPTFPSVWWNRAAVPGILPCFVMRHREIPCCQSRRQDAGKINS